MGIYQKPDFQNKDSRIFSYIGLGCIIIMVLFVILFLIIVILVD